MNQLFTPLCLTRSDIMLYLGDEKATLFKGDRRPVSLYLGDKKVTGYEYAEQTGEHLDFEGTYNDAASVVINGKSEQVQTEQGKNWLDINKYEASSDGIDISGNYISCQKVAQWSKYLSYSAKHMKFIHGQTHTLSMRVYSSTVAQTSFSIIFYKDGVNVFSTVSAFASVGSVLQKSFLINFDFDSMRIFFARSESAETADIVLTDVQFELGSTATEYEPFVPNSPSPEYPSPIKSVGDDGGFDLVSAGNNLFDGQFTIIGIGNYSNNDGVISKL
jgi:hypothetical protein